MATLITTWSSTASLVSAMQYAVPDTFSKVEIAESGDYTGQLVAYDDDNNICFRLASRTNFTLCFRDGTTLPITSNWNINSIAVCKNGVIIARINGSAVNDANIMIAKDHRGKIAFYNTIGGLGDFYGYHGDSNANESFSYGNGQQKDQTNLCRAMLPKAGTETNYFEHGYVSEQYNTMTPMACTIAGHTFVLINRLYLMDE